MGVSYKGAIRFGLVYIPITLTPAIRTNQIHFNLIEKSTMSRVQYKKTCVACDNREVNAKDIVKGYEYEEGKYVIFNDEDFEKIKSTRDKNITIEQFVDLADIDPIYYNRPYYVIPSKGAAKVFALLKEAMENEHQVGIARSVLGTKETLIAIRIKDGSMLLNTLNFYEEILPVPFQEEKVEVHPQEISLATTLIQSMKRPFEPENFVDEYRLKIEQAIEAKIEGKEVVAPAEAENQVLDLMSALQLSINNQKQQPPA